jgi:hypothetical protein
MDRLFGYMNRVSELIAAAGIFPRLPRSTSPSGVGPRVRLMKTQEEVKALTRAVECDVVPIDLIDRKRCGRRVCDQTAKALPHSDRARAKLWPRRSWKHARCYS